MLHGRRSSDLQICNSGRPVRMPAQACHACCRCCSGLPSCVRRNCAADAPCDQVEAHGRPTMPDEALQEKAGARHVAECNDTRGQASPSSHAVRHRICVHPRLGSCQAFRRSSPLSLNTRGSVPAISVQEGQHHAVAPPETCGPTPAEQGPHMPRQRKSVSCWVYPHLCHVRGSLCLHQCSGPVWFGC